MKKITLVLCAGIITVSSLSSCKKFYTCECTSINGKVETRDVLAVTRAEAQKNCDEYGLLGHCEIQ